MAEQNRRIFYDATCGICTGAAARWARILEPRGFRFVPLQSAEARSRLHLAEGDVPDEMKVETRSGEILGGVDGLLYLARHVWWASPAWMIGNIPGIHAMLGAAYRAVARRRHRLGCKLEP